MSPTRSVCRTILSAVTLSLSVCTGCLSDGPGAGGATSPNAPSSPSSPDDPPTGPTTTPGTCEASPSLEIRDVTVAEGRIGTDRALQVALSEPATVAALCAADGDPTEAHLVESASPARSHELRLQGLLPDTDYTCRVAPLCPAMAAPAAEIAVRAGPGVGLPALEVEVDPTLGMTGYWTLLPYLQGACSNDPRWLALYDADGVARWWYELPRDIWIDVEALYHPEDRTIVWGGGDGEAGGARVVDLWDGDVQVTAFPGSDELVFSHDAKRLPDGRLVNLDYRRTLNPDGDPFSGFGVTAHDPATGEVSFDLASQRYLDEGWLSPGPARSDPYHANWFDWVEAAGGDRLYVSLCSDWSVMSFDVGTGDVRYRIAAGEGWDVRDPAGDPLPDRELPQCTHGNEVVGDDVLLVYDNGQDRGESRIVELTVDVDAHAIVLDVVWTDGWWEGSLGDVDDLGAGRLLVTQAHPECWSESPGARSAIVEVDRASGRVASRLGFPRSADTTYRAERYDGCALMSSLRACPALADRAEALGAVTGW